MNSPRITFSSGVGAWYKPGMDHVNVPPMVNFPKIEEFYCTYFHELIHSTGAKHRLNREGITEIVRFGSKTYSKEELVAEIGASFLCGICGMDTVTFDNSVAYIQSWIKKLKDDKTLIVKASGHSQKAVDYILGVKWDSQGE